MIFPCISTTIYSTHHPFANSNPAVVLPTCPYCGARARKPPLGLGCWLSTSCADCYGMKGDMEWSHNEVSGRWSSDFVALVTGGSASKVTKAPKESAHAFPSFWDLGYSSWPSAYL